MNETYKSSDPMEDFGPVTQGDLESDARGTGARKSAGKPQWFQVPFWALRGALFTYRANLVSMESDVANLDISPIRRIERIVLKLADWQRGGGPELIDAALAETLHFLQREYMNTLDGLLPAGSAPLFPLAALKDVAGVLEFGAGKYPFCKPELAKGKDGRPTPASAGNWAKGMPWSTAFSCAMSHLLKRGAGSVYDEESGKDHMAHVAVNLLFLSAYRDLYPEGDDRIKQFRKPEPVIEPGPLTQVDMAAGPDASVKAVYQHVGAGIQLKHWARGNTTADTIEYAHPNCEICKRLVRK